MKNEIKSSYPIPCIGSAPAGLELDPNITTVVASVTIHSNGNRQVGCTFLKEGACNKFGESREYKSHCIHLYPEKSTTS